ncbi:hypothetical protein DER46DRAFT_703560 [Fusarium sp. MPI-SDFR-AT-0072]|nr:hypothetical protein DER46DRAFT_703560 [Fusarium sp. MPI-SDFR-AT-0072]
MKEQRSELKDELRNRKTQQVSNQDDDEWSEKAMLQQDLKEEEESEIRPIKKALTKAQQSPQTNSAPLKSVEGRCFRLWSTDHDPNFRAAFNPNRRGKVDGHIYAVSTDMCDIDPFVPPKNASLKTVRFDGNGGRHTFDVQFFDEHHLIVKIPKDLVSYRQEISPPSEAPHVFNYYGICEDYEESRILANDRREDRAERRRSASPA